MLAVKRREKIKELLFENKSVIVGDLAKIFNVTEETIRRDLTLLEKEKILIRTYGGAFIQEGVINDISARIRENVLVSNKEKIGSCAYNLISNGDSVFIDSSTTSLYLAKQLINKRIVVTTDSLNIANVFANSDTVKLYLVGGKYNPNTMSFIGSRAVSNISRYFFDKCFISCRSINRNFGITDSNEHLAEIRSFAIKHSNKSYLLCDHSKFDRTSFEIICTFNDIHGIITDEEPSKDWKTFFKKQHIQLITPFSEDNKNNPLDK